VHMVRFAWREDIGKKAKIMRKVKFPQEFDALDLATDELRAKLLPASRRLKEIEKERGERRKVRKRTKQAAPAAAGPSSAIAPATTDVEMADASPAQAVSTEGVASAGGSKDKEVGLGEPEDEITLRKKETAELAQLIDEEVKRDVGCSATGLYELVAIVTHKGAAADAGHYIGFVKKSVFHAYKNKGGISSIASTSTAASEDAPSPETTAADLDAIEDDEDWYKFDDEKVSLFPKEKLATLDGGGEDSSAYVLLYRSKSVA